MKTEIKVEVDYQKELMKVLEGNIFIKSDSVSTFMKNVDEKSLVKFFKGWCFWNNQFAPSVLKLAYNFGNELNIEIRKDSIIKHIPYNSKVTAYLLDSVEHEYAEKIGDQKITHLELNWFLVETIKQYFNCRIAGQDEKIMKYSKDVHDFYKGKNLNQFVSLGFHIASEYYATFEYEKVINGLTKNESLKDFIKFLQMSSHPTQTNFSAYHWIEVHTQVEELHFQATLALFNLLMNKDTIILDRINFKVLKKSKIMKLIVKGINQFIDHEHKVFKHLTKNI